MIVPKSFDRDNIISRTPPSPPPTKMDYIDDSSTRPRFQFQPRPSAAAGGGATASASPDTLLQIGRLPAAACFTSAALLLIPAAHLSPHPVSLLLLWISLSLLAGPFAPASLTFGDPTVGRGPPLPPPSPASSDSDDNAKKPHPRRHYKSHDTPPVPAPVPLRSNPTHNTTNDSASSVTEEEWGEGDYELLKKQLAKHPVGAPQRWERVAEAFKGRHGVDSVIRTAKSMSEKRPGDSFAQFLKQRKPLDKRAEAVDGDVADKEWSGGEDIALLNALKAFPKEAPLRWEKVAAAVPGRSKAECVKRVGELKRDFRSSKGTEA